MFSIFIPLTSCLPQHNNISPNDWNPICVCLDCFIENFGKFARVLSEPERNLSPKMESKCVKIYGDYRSSENFPCALLLSGMEVCVCDLFESVWIEVD
jgi:hypothetical protein